MRWPHCRFKNLLLTFIVCVCGLLVFSTTLQASGTVTVFYLGQNDNITYTPAVSGDGAIPAGPYPGTMPTTTIQLFFCLSGNQSVGWGTEEASGSEAPPSGQAQEEAAFLASLVLYKASQNGITLTTSGTNGSTTLTQTQTGSMSTGTFVNTVEGPITMAIWQIMGTMPTEAPNNDPAAQTYVTQAVAAWTSILSNPANPLTVTFNNNAQVFTTSGGGQNFVSAYSDPGLMTALPEPGTMVLFGTGALLIVLGRVRRRARR